jgi:hypothetical protein
MTRVGLQGYRKKKIKKMSSFILFVNSEGTPHTGLLFPELIQGFI